MTKANQRAMVSVKRLMEADGAEKQWQELRRHCTVVRRVGSWVEYNDKLTGMSFFFQQRSGRTVFGTCCFCFGVGVGLFLDLGSTFGFFSSVY